MEKTAVAWVIGGLLAVAGCGGGQQSAGNGYVCLGGQPSCYCPGQCIESDCCDPRCQPLIAGGACSQNGLVCDLTRSSYHDGIYECTASVWSCTSHCREIPDMAVPGDALIENVGAATGEPCLENGDCANGPLATQTATCLDLTGRAPNLLMWILGYCTSPCRAVNTDMVSGLNSDCPGGNGTCADADHTCRAYCQQPMDCRDTYACFVVNNIAPFGCEPAALSECDPRVAKSCPPANGKPQTCVDVGAGGVGACVPSCNPLANTGCDPTDPNADSCHAWLLTGEGVCTNAAAQGFVAGDPCGNFYSDCAGGYGCLNGKCWKYCHNDVVTVGMQCGMALATCQPLTPMSPVPPSTIGICSISN